MYCSFSWISRALSTGSSGVFGHVTCSTLTASADASLNVFHGSGWGSVFAAAAVPTRSVSRAEPSSPDPGPLIAVVILTRWSSPGGIPALIHGVARAITSSVPHRCRRRGEKYPGVAAGKSPLSGRGDTTDRGAMPPRHGFRDGTARLDDDGRVEAEHH